MLNGWHCKDGWNGDGRTTVSNRHPLCYRDPNPSAAVTAWSTSYQNQTGLVCAVRIQKFLERREKDCVVTAIPRELALLHRATRRDGGKGGARR